MKPDPQALERLKVYHEYGIDVKTRTINLTATIDEVSVDYMLTNIDFLESVSDDPIRFIISTFGGEEIEALSLIEAMKTSDCVIETLARGKCMSAGPLIVASGDVGCRRAYRSVQWMIHVGDGAVEGTYHQLESDMKWYKKMNNTWLEMMEEYTRMPQSHWKKLTDRNSDVFFSSEDALEWGIIDEII